ncbi:hypothetical protein C2G38_2187871 [Gigaspora rosea]|uniref:Uncharacterized protein n=1 Tax=Gigaspora rosea TaxID=44941 RepID=A0A397V450_9GLOM|nr:hypothetical protein C2G38_2187871 [Gigaspora rosea]
MPEKRPYVKKCLDELNLDELKELRKKFEEIKKITEASFKKRKCTVVPKAIILARTEIFYETKNGLFFQQVVIDKYKEVIDKNNGLEDFHYVLIDCGFKEIEIFSDILIEDKKSKKYLEKQRNLIDLKLQNKVIFVNSTKKNYHQKKEREKLILGKVRRRLLSNLYDKYEEYIPKLYSEFTLFNNEANICEDCCELKEFWKTFNHPTKLNYINNICQQYTQNICYNTSKQIKKYGLIDETIELFYMIIQKIDSKLYELICEEIINHINNTKFASSKQGIKIYSNFYLGYVGVNYRNNLEWKILKQSLHNYFLYCDNYHLFWEYFKYI